jgi:putative transposase
LGSLRRRGRLTSTSDREIIIQLVEEAVASGARQSKACHELGISARTFQRWTSPNEPDEDQRPLAVRPEPKNKLSEKERESILKTVNQPEYADRPPSQIIPDLADKGIYIASESTFYRVMHAANQIKHRGRSERASKRTITSYVATAPNQVWSWDITYLSGPIKGLYYYLYLILDIFSRDIVGWEVWEDESAEHASHLIRKAVLAQGISRNHEPLILHSDNGSPMKGATMLHTLYELGITPSRSRPRVSNDNPYSESMFRTCKYRPDYPVNGFSSLESSREWCLSFVRWYRFEHHHSKIGFVTPHQAHTGISDKILENRKRVYELAKQRNPLRWSRSIRTWSSPKEVWLNPEKDFEQDLRQLS